jgi:hypothetical protein
MKEYDGEYSDEPVEFWQNHFGLLCLLILVVFVLVRGL